MRAFTAISFFVASALALSVTQPTTGDIWSLSGSHTVAWTVVSSDPTNFTIVLVNEQVNPTYTQELKALVPSSDTNTTVDPPATGWPTGKGFQINLVADANDLNAILAQSQQFTFGTSSSSSSSGSSSKTSSTLVVTSTSGLNTPTGTSNGFNSGSSVTSTSTTPATSNNAVGGINIQTGFIAAVALLGAALA